jgi:hypothetical protein
LNIRARKLAGALALIALVVIYSLIAMVIGSSILVEANGWQKFLVYAISGLGWVFPAMPLIRWMQRPEK